MARIYVTNKEHCDIHVFYSSNVVGVKFGYAPSIENPESCVAILELKDMHPDNSTIAFLSKKRDCDNDADKFSKACEVFKERILKDIWGHYVEAVWFDTSKCNYYRKDDSSCGRTEKTEVIIASNNKPQQANNPIY